MSPRQCLQTCTSVLSEHVACRGAERTFGKGQAALRLAFVGYTDFARSENNGVFTVPQDVLNKPTLDLYQHLFLDFTGPDAFQQHLSKIAGISEFDENVTTSNMLEGGASASALLPDMRSAGSFPGYGQCYASMHMV